MAGDSLPHPFGSRTHKPCAQPLLQGGGMAWKTGCFRGAPWWVRAVMAANFRSLPGAWAVAGLMGVPLWLWSRRWGCCQW